jgi:molybdenum cofactor cytidylyltransferase
MKPHAAVVLAAGGSKRLGRAKQLLRRDGETLVHRAVRLAATTSPTRLLVVLGADATRMEAELRSCDCEIVLNDAWQEGLASSLRVAARALSAFDGKILVLGCDQPALEEDHLASLVDGANCSPSGAAATLHAGLPGIPAVVPATWFASFAATGNHGFGATLRELPKESLFLLDVAALEFDVDTLQDTKTAVARKWLDSN